MSVQELKDLQEKDKSLEKSLEDVRTAADKSPAVSDCGFFRRRGILCRRWFPRWRIKPMEMLMPSQELILRETT